MPFGRWAVGEDMARDLMSFGKPILVLGDPGQLPPIKGEGAFTTAQPDIMLTEIHRQAAESAIIRLATMVREGKPIGFGQYDTFVWKMPKSDVTAEQALRGGQVICGMNATRLQLNNAMRQAAGFADGWLPTGPAEKIICLKNQNDLGLINGMFVTLDDIVDEGSRFISATVAAETITSPAACLIACNGVTEDKGCLRRHSRSACGIGQDHCGGLLCDRHRWRVGVA
jgi:exodeoxyribonuclease-5